MVNSHYGSMFTMAPEILYLKHYDERCDIYSLGVTFYNLLFCDFPHIGTTPHQIHKSIKENPLNLARHNIQISPEMKNLHSNMITDSPKNRMNFDQLFRHPLFHSLFFPKPNPLPEAINTVQILLVGESNF